MFHQFRLLRAEFSYKLRASHSDRFYIMRAYNDVPELAYECQGQVRSTMVIIQKKNEEEEARDTSSIGNFRLILER